MGLLQQREAASLQDHSEHGTGDLTPSLSHTQCGRTQPEARWQHDPSMQSTPACLLVNTASGTKGREQIWGTNSSPKAERLLEFDVFPKIGNQLLLCILKYTVRIFLIWQKPNYHKLKYITLIFNDFCGKTVLPSYPLAA